MKTGFISNPFQITTPEDLPAEETVALFVDVFTDFQKIIDPGHVFLLGPRGVGKSMMFRYLQPDCQCIVKNCKLNELPFIGIYIPLKNTNFSLAELKRLENRHASDILNEHIMVTHFCVKIFNSLTQSNLYQTNEDVTDIMKYYTDVFLPEIGWTGIELEDFGTKENITISDVFAKMANIMERIYKDTMSYAKKLAFSNELIPYYGPLFDYIDFLIPILTGLLNTSSFTKGTIYLLIDDAQCLTDTQARVLNSWVGTRTSGRISLKISTQYNYKTFYTTTGAVIDTPHDYYEIDITTIFTGISKSKYRNRVKDIVEKRLSLKGINISAEEFFPEDYEQEKKIEKIAQEYRERYDRGEGKGYNRTDDAIRYARPDFIKSLAGSKKSSSTYSYAGFNQLVHLSSGIVRHFLHPAYLMYAKTKSQSNSEVTFIPASVQSEIIRDEANSFLFKDLDKYEQEGHENAFPKEDIVKLSNLIQGLGSLFRHILLSERSERRVFSIALNDKASDDVSKILNLGVQLGYFHQSTIGKKESKSGGRTKLYIMNRRLAPIWNLDPTGFAGYLFLPNSTLEGLINDSRYLNKIRNIVDENTDSEFTQMSFFDDSDEYELGTLGEEGV
ncbi:MAG: hypothetical protein BWX72_00396 [Firmicutes bacterium ADurb.Bin080]|nr:MAG: hypothetical protein BWX72_00396 [Firmicutes bacterium ADurb.Bin080]